MQPRRYFSKASAREKRAMIVQKTREAEEERRLVKATGLSKQGRNLQWNVPQKILKDRDIITLPEARLKFLVKSVYDLLPTPANKNLWFKTDEFSCQLCGKKGTLNHIFTGCEIALAQGRYKWRHDKVLAEIARCVELKMKLVNSQPLRKKRLIKFVKGGSGKP